MLYNVVQQSELAICIHTSLPPSPSHPSRSPQSAELSSLCCEQLPTVCLFYSWQRTFVIPSLLIYPPALPYLPVQSLHMHLYFCPANRLICILDPLSEHFCSLPWHLPSHHRTLPRGPASRLLCPESFCGPKVSSGHYCAAAEPAPQPPGYPLLRESTLPHSLTRAPCPCWPGKAKVSMAQVPVSPEGSFLLLCLQHLLKPSLSAMGTP